jgi:hypothetical protein
MPLRLLVSVDYSIKPLQCTRLRTESTGSTHVATTKVLMLPFSCFDSSSAVFDLTILQGLDFLDNFHYIPSTFKEALGQDYFDH